MRSIYYVNSIFSVVDGNENLPVVFVSWYGAKAFAEYYGLDLPREAEWEYACRGGNQYKYGTDDGTLSISKANFSGNYIDGQINVGSYPANPFGIYDMSGNVWEWCGDSFAYGYYSSASVTNPTGPSIGGSRILRGGAYSNTDVRSAYRSWGNPTETYGNHGFRVVRRP
ncbi:Serine/threonine-protein kinase Pkn1 [subsurface metagenome]